MASVYVIGSLRNDKVPDLASDLRDEGYDVFDDWYCAGPEADDCWQRYEKSRGHSYNEALQGFAAQHVFRYDKHHLERCDAVVLLMPCGRSGHIELGVACGMGKPAFVLFPEEPERFDVMYAFTRGVFTDEEELIEALHKVLG